MQPVAKEAVSVATECKDDEGSDAESEVSVQMDVACGIAFCRAVLLDQRQVCHNSNTDHYFLSNLTEGGGEYKTKSGLGLVWQRNYSDFFRTTTEMVSLRHSESPL